MRELVTLKDVEFRNKDEFFLKLRSFTKKGKSKLHLLLDFDRTLTTSQNGLGENTTTWEVLRTHLSKKEQREYQKFYRKYRTLEVENRITTADAVEWWEGILKLFQKSKLKWSEMAKDIEEKMPIRPYTKELFEICERKNIPTIIISAGIKDVIELWCQKFEINLTIILSTDLTFSSEGYMNGWHKESLIHILNKREKGHQEIRKIKSDKTNAILIGDSVNDAAMINGEKNVLRIGIYDPPKKDEMEKFREFTRKFDLVIKDKTLYTVTKILNLF